MSQIPPPGQPPYGQPMPPGQPVPYGQPTTPGGYQMPPTQTNGWGLTSLIVGIVSFCAPIVGGLLAILFGFFGIRKSKVTRSGGGMSIAGIILGVLSLLFWALFGGGIYAFVRGTAPMRDAARQMVLDLAAGDMSAAQADTDGTVSQDDLQTVIDVFKPHGTVADVTSSSVSAGSGGTGDVGGVATFADKFQVKFQFGEVKSGDKWKVSKITIVP